MSALLAFAARMRLGTVIAAVGFILLAASITAARHYRERAAALETALYESNRALQQCTKSNADANSKLAAIRAASDKMAAEAAAAAREASEARTRVERRLAIRAAAPVASTCEAAVAELADSLAQEPTK